MKKTRCGLAQFVLMGLIMGYFQASGHPSNKMHFPDDSLLVRTVPYYTFVQPYDSSVVEFYFGELALHRAGNKRGIVSDAFQVTRPGDPYHHWPTEEEQAQATRYRWFTPQQGDSISYYFDLVVTARNGSACHTLDIGDTLMVILQIVDSTSNTVVDHLDSLGILPTTNRSDLLSNIQPSVFVSSDNGMKRLPDSLVGQKICFQLKAEFRGSESRNLFCRRDDILPYVLSENAQTAEDQYLHIMDSVLTILGVLSKSSSHADRPRMPNSFRVDIAPNPANSQCLVTWTSREFSGKVSLHLFDMDGRMVHQVGYTGLAAGTHAMKMDLSSIPNGSYYLVHISDGNIMGTSRFNIIK